MSNKPTDPSRPESNAKASNRAGLFPEEILESIKPRLLDYLEELECFLYPSGSSYAGCCPIHDDTRPSFSVYGEHLHRWKCFTCDLGGNVFDMSIALRRSSSFPEAVREVAETLGVELPPRRKSWRHLIFRKREEKQREPKPMRPEPEMDISQAEFRELARRLLREMAIDYPEKFAKFSAELGIPVTALKRAARGASGLGIVDGQLAYVYPKGVKVRNPAGSKQRFYWAFGKATAPWRFDRVTEATETIYLTEGESDALALIACGVEDDRKTVVVASPGTSFPAQWAPLFSAKHVVIGYDFDTPGLTAARKVAHLLSQHATSVRIIKPLNQNTQPSH